MASLAPLFDYQPLDNSGQIVPGGRLWTYETGTVTLKVTYRDQAGTVTHTNPIVLDTSGRLPGGGQLWLGSGEYTFRLEDAEGEIWTRSDVGAPEVSGSAAALDASLRSTSDADKGPGQIGFSQAMAYAAATAGHKLKQEVSITDHPYLCVGDGGVTNNTAGMIAAFAAAAGRIVRIPKAAGYYKITGGVSLPANTTVIWESGAEVRCTSKPPAAAGTFEGGTVYACFEATGDNVASYGKGILSGPSTATYVANEAAIFRHATSSAARGYGIEIQDLEIKNFGAYGVLTEYMDGVTLEDIRIHDVGYAGALLGSASHVRVKGGEIGNITPGTAGNAYGITLSNNSTGYNLDPNAGLKSATNPFCWDVVIDGLTVYDIPIWQGIDAHGGYEVTVTNCRTYNCKLGVAVSSGSGAASNYAGKYNQVINNIIQVAKRDGSATTVAASPRTGISVNGGSLFLNDGVIVSGNIIDGYGDTTPAGASISATYARNAVISGNVFKNWAGQGIYSSNGGGIIDGNIFDAVTSATNSVCIYTDSTTDSWQITDNRHAPTSGTVAAEGLRIASANPRCLITGNNFTAATSPYVNVAGTNTYGASDITPQITVTGTPTTISVAAAGASPLVIVDLSVSGPSTISTITGSFIGQRIEFFSSTANATTIDRTQCALSGGVNYVSSIYDAITLRCISGGAVKYAEVSRSINA